jgi:regulator of replication initiation timing
MNTVKTKTHYELIYNKDIQDNVYGNTILVASKGETHSKHKTVRDAVKFLFDNGSHICCAVHGHGVYSYCKAQDLSIVKVEEVKRTTKTPITHALSN